MENTINISLPESVYHRLEATIISTVEKCLNDHINKIHAAPVHRTRAETKEIVKSSYPTLRKFEEDGVLVPKRAGRRVLYDQRDIDKFLDSNRGRN